MGRTSVDGGKRLRTKKRLKRKKTDVVDKKESAAKNQSETTLNKDTTDTISAVPGKVKATNKRIKRSRKAKASLVKTGRKKLAAKASASKSESAINLKNPPEKEGGLRANPQILCVGTPGVGKTSFSNQLAQLTGMRHIEVSRLITEKKLYNEWDDDLDCSIFDEDMVVEELEAQLAASAKGAIVDWHCCEIFPDEWFDLVVILRCVNDVLYPRLESRGYPPKKISENIEAEIFEVVAEEAREAFDVKKIWQKQSETNKDMEDNLNSVKNFVDEWRQSQ